jgi:MFS family permease
MEFVTRLFPRKLHYAWVVAAITFLTLLAAAGVRATPSVMMVPLEESFGWNRTTISFAIAVNIILYGLMGPFAAALMLRIGIRRSIMLALGLTAGSVALSTFMTAPWQFVLTWGVAVGLGTGVTALVLAATVVNRWFTERRGLVMGVLTASTATGQLVFLPMLASVASGAGWRPMAWIVALVAAAAIPIIFVLMPERPEDVSLRSYGDASDAPPPARNQANPIVVAFSVLGRATKSRNFWLLFGSFFICGASTNGLIGTHLIAACIDQGIPEVRGASLLAAMGVFDLVGTTLSGWLSDRYDNRVLLFWYYGLRGLSLLFLPYSGFTFMGLSLFAAFYGLDWIATVPPTLRLINDIFGKQDAPVIFGWVAAGHQLGAGSATFAAGLMRTTTGAYTLPFLAAGALCVAGALMVLVIGRGIAKGDRRRLQPAT